MNHDVACTHRFSIVTH